MCEKVAGRAAIVAPMCASYHAAMGLRGTREAGRPGTETPDEPPPDLSEALVLLLRGESEAGLAAYREGIRGDFVHLFPIGLHLLFLRRAGRAAEAEALRDLALDRGATLAVKAGGFGAGDEEAAGEYEELFAEGIANSRMVSQYLLILTRLGRRDDVSALLGPDLLLRRVYLDLPPSGPGAASLAAEVERLLLDLEDEAQEADSTQSVRRMRKLERFHALDHPAARALTAALKTEGERYLADWAESGHPLARIVPGRARLAAWGLISRGEGFNVPHIHYRGWATGVYYPAGIDSDGNGGSLCVGPPEGAGDGAGWPRAEIRPEPGLLVLMPSYYTHWTVPLGRPGLRLSVAFDLRRERKIGGIDRASPLG
jgi:hypothetical protein